MTTEFELLRSAGLDSLVSLSPISNILCLCLPGRKTQITRLMKTMSSCGLCSMGLNVHSDAQAVSRKCCLDRVDLKR